MKNLKIFPLFLFLALMSRSLWAADPFLTQTLPDGRTFSYVPNQVLVTFKNQSNAASQALIRGMGAKPMQSIGRTQLLQIPPGQSMNQFMDSLQNRNDVEFVEPNIIYRAFFTPNDTQFSGGNQAYLESAQLNFEPAWDITRGVSTIVIGVVDTGTSLTHPDIDGNLWTNPSNGFFGKTFEVNLNNDQDCTDLGEQCENDNPDDDNSVGSEYHGTHVAGLIAAETNNSNDIASVCHNCKIMSLKALGPTGVGTGASVAAAIRYGVDNGAQIINLSLGASLISQTIEEAITYATNNGVLLVAAAGNVPVVDLNRPNNCAVNHPASSEKVIAVGATNSSKVFSAISCKGKEMDVVAPGENILSLSNTGTGTLSGTSFSAPLVAGLAGLVKSLDSTMSPDDVTRFINFNADDLGSPGFDTSYGFGYINPLRTLQAVQSAQRNPDGSYLFVSNSIAGGDTFPAPNPYNPTSGEKVTIHLPPGHTAAGLRIEIFTASGRKVKTITGTNKWDGRNEKGNMVASGLYFYYARTDQGDAEGKITILK